MSKILVLGAGFVAAPLVNYLVRKNYHITVASQFLHEAEAISSQYNDVVPCELNVSDSGVLANKVSDFDLVVSFVPFVFHEQVARVCLEQKKHLVTASYETETMRSFDQQAKENDIIIVNEIGLDPGIDHLSAMQIFDEIKQQGGTLDSFVSWCGGIPAPAANDNPLGYKFSWSPKSVLLALLNEARFVEEGEIKIIPSSELLNNIETVTINEQLTLEGYANRDSTSYVDSYSIGDAKKVLRGTLRYVGFSKILQACKELNMLDQSTETMAKFETSNWHDYLQTQTPNLDDYLNKAGPIVKEAFDWLGLTSTEIIPKADSMLDAFCQFLVEKLSYADDESDMVVMQHQFLSTNTLGEKEYRTSTLVLEGDPNGYSAMAKTVGTPAAITVDLILTGKIKRRGVVLPLTSDFYEPIMTELRNEGIDMQESLIKAI